MSRSTLNKVYLMGFAGRDGELRYTQGGVAMGTVNIATNRATRRNGEFIEATDWHRLKAFGPLGEVLGAVRKGECLFVEAELQYSRWTDKEQRIHYVTDLVVKEVVKTSEHDEFVPEYEPRGEEPPLPEEA